MGMAGSRWFQHVYKVTDKNTSAYYSNLMKYGYVESHKPSRDGSSWVFGMVKADININDVARHFDIHKTQPLTE